MDPAHAGQNRLDGVDDVGRAAGHDREAAVPGAGHAAGYRRVDQIDAVTLKILAEP